MLDWADEHGIVVIDETVVVGFNLSLGIGFEAGNKPKELYSEEQPPEKPSRAQNGRRFKSDCVTKPPKRGDVSIANEPDTRPRCTGIFKKQLRANAAPTRRVRSPASM